MQQRHTGCSRTVVRRPDLYRLGWSPAEVPESFNGCVGYISVFSGFGFNQSTREGWGHTDTSQLQLPMLCIPEISTAFIPERNKVLVFIKGLNSTAP